MEHIRGAASNAFTARSLLILEDYSLCQIIQQQFSKVLQFIDTNILEDENLFTERNQQLYLNPLSFSSGPCLISKTVSIPFPFFKSQLFQRLGPLTRTENRAVFRNVRVMEKFIKGNWWDKHDMLHQIVLTRHAESFCF